MGKPTFSYTYVFNNIAPCKVIFTATPQSDVEEVTLFDFGDGRLYNCNPQERVVLHEYLKAGKYLAKALAGKVMSEPVEITIISGSQPDPDPNPEPVVKDGLIVRFLKWLLHLFGG